MNTVYFALACSFGVVVGYGLGYVLLSYFGIVGLILAIAAMFALLVYLIYDGQQ